MTFPSRTRTDRWDLDPEYVVNRAIVRARRAPCWRCGGMIAYDEPYWLKVNGKRRVNLSSFVCGHIVSRAAGGSHALTNLRAEHAGCSLRSGAVEGAQRGNAKRRGRERGPRRGPAGYLRIDDW